VQCGKFKKTPYSMDWLKGKSTGNHRFSHEIWGVPVIFPLNQSIDIPDGVLRWGTHGTGNIFDVKNFPAPWPCWWFRNHVRDKANTYPYDLAGYIPSNIPICIYIYYTYLSYLYIYI